MNFAEFVLVLCNDSKKTSRKKQRKAKKRQQQQLNATSGTGLGTTSEAVTATLPTSSTTLARPPQPQVSGINDCIVEYLRCWDFKLFERSFVCLIWGFGLFGLFGMDVCAVILSSLIKLARPPQLQVSGINDGKVEYLCCWAFTFDTFSWCLSLLFVCLIWGWARWLSFNYQHMPLNLIENIIPVPTSTS